MVDSKTPVPIIDDDLSFDSMIINPILKPISEVNTKIIDLEEMIFKKTQDMEKDKKWIDETYEDIPEYSSSVFINRIVKLKEEMTDILKIQDLEIASLKLAIKEINNLVKEKYGIWKEKSSKDKDIKVSSVDYISYLNSIQGESEEIAKVAIQKMGSDNSKKRFDEVLVSMYKQEEDKKKKEFIREFMKLNPMEVK